MPTDISDLVDLNLNRDGSPKVTEQLADFDDNLTPQAQSNIKYAMDKNPDQQAAVQQLADEMGMNVRTVEENFDEVKKRKRAEFINGVDNPALAKYLTDQMNAEVSHDDLDTLSAIENEVNRHFRAASSGIASFPEMAIGGAASMLEMTDRKIKQYFPEDVATFLTTPVPLWKPDVGESVQGVSDVLRGAQKDIAEYRESVAPKAWMQDSTSMQVASGLGQAASQIATAPLGAPAMLASLFTSGVEQQAERQRETGTYGESDTALLASGAVGMVLQKLGLDAMMGKLSSNVQNAVMRKVSDVAMAAAVEGGTEVTEDVVHATIEKLTTNPEADVTEGWEENMTVGAIVGGLVRAALPGTAYKGEVDKNKKKIGESAVGAIEKTMGEQQTLDTLIPLLEQSTTGKRSAKALKRFVETLPEGTEVRINPAAFDGIKAPLPDYVQTQIDGLGSDVIVKMDQLAKDFVQNPELLNAARKHMRLSETAMTQSEVETGSAETIRNLMEEAKANAELKNEADAIFKDIVDQLVATGRMSKESARMNAVLIPAYITVKSKETGIGVAEIYERMNLTIKKAEPRGEKGSKQKSILDSVRSGKNENGQYYTLTTEGVGEYRVSHSGSGIYAKTIADSGRRSDTVLNEDGDFVDANEINKLSGESSERAFTTTDNALRDLIARLAVISNDISVSDDISKQANQAIVDLVDGKKTVEQVADDFAPKKPDFGDEKMTTDIISEETGQKGKMRELKQVVYDRLAKRRDVVTKLRDCLNA